MDETINVYTNNHADPGLAAFLMLLLVVALVSMWLFSLWQWVLARRSAAAAKVEFEQQSALREGARFVSGKVEYADGESVAVRVTITQHGSEVRGKSASHRWTETERQVEKRPFYLRLDSGERVLVETTNANVLLVDKLDRMHWVQKWQRQKRAQLDVGERAFAEGILRRRHDPNAAGIGYRDAGTSWVLMPLARRIHVSTEDASQRHKLRARAFAWAMLLLPLWALGALLPVYPYFARLKDGRDEQAGYLGRYHYTTRTSKGQIVHHWVARYSGERDYGSVEVDESDFNRALPEHDVVTSDVRRTIWVRFVDGSPKLTTVGRGSTVHFGAWCVSLALVCGVG
ncbi:MAG: hypothetical protein U0269_26490, partial [Polyangiales bacterium]